MTPFRLFQYIVAVGAAGAVVILIFVLLALVVNTFFIAPKAEERLKKMAAKRNQH